MRVHLDLKYTGPPRKGGPSDGHVTVRRSRDPPDGGSGFDQSHHGRISAVGPTLRGRVSEPHGRLAPRWAAAHGPAVHHLPELSAADARGSAAIYPRLPEDLSAPSRPGTTVRHGPEQGSSVDSRALGGPALDAARAGGCPDPVLDRAGEPPRGDRG